MVWTDPPYGVDYSSKNEALNATDRGSRVQRPIENDALTPEETGPPSPLLRIQSQTLPHTAGENTATASLRPRPPPELYLATHRHYWVAQGYGF